MTHESGDRNEHIIRGGYVLTLDPQLGEFESADILVRDGKIVEIAPHIESDLPEIDARGCVVIPGFVDTHTHMWNSMWHTVHQPYERVHNKLGRHFTPTDSATGVRLTATDMLKSGVTTVHAWEHNCRTPEHVDAELTALRDSGIRRHYSYGYHHDFLPEQMTDFDDIERARDEWTDELTTVGFASRPTNVPAGFPFPTATPEVREAEFRAARERGLRVTHHVGSAGSSHETYIPLASDGAVFVHAYHWGVDAWKQLADIGTSSSMAPYSSMGYRVPMPFDALIESGINVSLSFDHLGGPGSADPFRAMHIAYHQSRFTNQTLEPKKLLEFATLGGAKALGLSEKTGSLSIGKSADIVVIRTNRLGVAPMVDPYLAVVNSAQPSDVDTVMVGGRLLKHEGALTAVDPNEVTERALETLPRLMKAAGLTPTGALTE